MTVSHLTSQQADQLFSEQAGFFVNDLTQILELVLHHQPIYFIGQTKFLFSWRCSLVGLLAQKLKQMINLLHIEQPEANLCNVKIYCLNIIYDKSLSDGNCLEHICTCNNFLKINCFNGKWCLLIIPSKGTANHTNNSFSTKEVPLLRFTHMFIWC